MTCSPHLTIHRRTLIIGLPTLALLFAPALASAEGGGGKPRNTLKKHYTQNQFLRMVPSDYQAGALSTRTHRIGNFSGTLSNMLFVMAYYDRRATQRLVRDMAKLTSRKARLKRLKSEIDKVQKHVAGLNASVKRLKTKSGIGAELALRSEWDRLDNTEHYLKLVKYWAKHPMDGGK